MILEIDKFNSMALEFGEGFHPVSSIPLWDAEGQASIWERKGVKLTLFMGTHSYDNGIKPFMRVESYDSITC